MTCLFVIISTMNIFQTFELFLSQPLSIIRDRIIQICHVESENISVDNKIQFNLSNESAQINVYNNPKIYNLLSAVLYKKKKLSEIQYDNKKSTIHNKRTKALTVSKF